MTLLVHIFSCQSVIIIVAMTNCFYRDWSTWKWLPRRINCYRTERLFFELLYKHLFSFFHKQAIFLKYTDSFSVDGVIRQGTKIYSKSTLGRTHSGALLFQKTYDSESWKNINNEYNMTSLNIFTELKKNGASLTDCHRPFFELDRITFFFLFFELLKKIAVYLRWPKKTGRKIK